MAERHVSWTELDRQLNELAHNIGMERQHKKLIRQLLVNTAQAFYHDGYDDGIKDNEDRREAGLLPHLSDSPIEEKVE